MPTDQDRSLIQETLLHLYLRLNGYFVSGFIAHSSEHGKNRTQIDALAIRPRFSREPDRVVGPSPFLKPVGTDLLICEVKSRSQPLQFNESFRKSDAAIRDVLGWAGLFDELETVRVAVTLKPLLQPSANALAAESGASGEGMVRVRDLLCCPEKHTRRNNQPWFLCGTEMFRYISECLNPDTLRDTCSTHYDTNLWGSSFAPFVRYFKSVSSRRQANLSDLYQYLSRFPPSGEGKSNKHKLSRAARGKSESRTTYFA